MRVLWAIAAAVGVGFFCRRARRWRTIYRAVRRFLNLLRRATGSACEADEHTIRQHADERRDRTAEMLELPMPMPQEVLELLARGDTECAALAAAHGRNA